MPIQVALTLVRWRVTDKGGPVAVPPWETEHFLNTMTNPRRKHAPMKLVFQTHALCRPVHLAARINHAVTRNGEDIRGGDLRLALYPIFHLHARKKVTNSLRSHLKHQFQKGLVSVLHHKSMSRPEIWGIFSQGGLHNVEIMDKDATPLWRVFNELSFEKIAFSLSLRNHFKLSPCFEKCLHLHWATSGQWDNAKAMHTSLKTINFQDSHVANNIQPLTGPKCTLDFSLHWLSLVITIRYPFSHVLELRNDR